MGAPHSMVAVLVCLVALSGGSAPTAEPTATPTSVPTLTPGATAVPTVAPTDMPTATPTGQPTGVPTLAPGATSSPATLTPGATAVPGSASTAVPTLVPGDTAAPTIAPTLAPDTAAPSVSTLAPGDTAVPTTVPTLSPGGTAVPTTVPTLSPGGTAVPTTVPTLAPGDTAVPTTVPTLAPDTAAPTIVPTLSPGDTAVPTTTPVSSATAVPTLTPGVTSTTVAPTAVPTLTPGTTSVPTAMPTAAPTLSPGATSVPTAVPTSTPTAPTLTPGDTAAPTAMPTTLTPGSTSVPTAMPTTVPSTPSPVAVSQADTIMFLADSGLWQVPSDGSSAAVNVYNFRPCTMGDQPQGMAYDPCSRLVAWTCATEVFTFSATSTAPELLHRREPNPRFPKRGIALDAAAGLVYYVVHDSSTGNQEYLVIKDTLVDLCKEKIQTACNGECEWVSGMCLDKEWEVIFRSDSYANAGGLSVSGGVTWLTTAEVSNQLIRSSAPGTSVPYSAVPTVVSQISKIDSIGHPWSQEGVGFVYFAAGNAVVSRVLKVSRDNTAGQPEVVADGLPAWKYATASGTPQPAFTVLAGGDSLAYTDGKKIYAMPFVSKKLNALYSQQSGGALGPVVSYTVNQLLSCPATPTPTALTTAPNTAVPTNAPLPVTRSPDTGNASTPEQLMDGTPGNGTDNGPAAPPEDDNNDLIVYIVVALIVAALVGCAILFCISRRKSNVSGTVFPDAGDREMRKREASLLERDDDEEQPPPPPVTISAIPREAAPMGREEYQNSDTWKKNKETSKRMLAHLRGRPIGGGEKKQQQPSKDIDEMKLKLKSLVMDDDSFVDQAVADWRDEQDYLASESASVSPMSRRAVSPGRENLSTSSLTPLVPLPQKTRSGNNLFPTATTTSRAAASSRRSPASPRPVVRAEQRDSLHVIT